jgi:hypothetical protein
MKPYFYEGGPMTGIPCFNFPRFREVADKLRASGYTIVSPAELDDEHVEREAMESETGSPDSVERPYMSFLARDITICADPACIGGIFLEDWRESRGARAEAYVLSFLEKQVFEYDEDFDGSPILCLLTADDISVSNAELSDF